MPNASICLITLKFSFKYSGDNPSDGSPAAKSGSSAVLVRTLRERSRAACARLRFGKNPYRLITNGCEHFCAWCLYGASRSEQAHACIIDSRVALRISAPSKPPQSISAHVRVFNHSRPLCHIRFHHRGELLRCASLQDGALTTQTRH